jgi:hypothetical protein
MSRQPISDEAIRQAHAELWRIRAAAAEGVPAVSVETIQALAAGTYSGSDRLELLDRIVGHPVTARELQFFSELAAMTPAPVVRRNWGPWALAASALLAVGVAAAWGLRNWGADEEVRGGRSGFALIEPAPDQPVARATRFLWRSVATATVYRLEVVNAEGDVVVSLETPDTAAVVPDSVLLTPGAYLARVVATRQDGTEERTPAARLTIR